jgi:hypothetical protein
MHLRGDLTNHFVATGDVLTHRHHGEPAPSDDRLAELLDDADVQEFLDACLASAAEVSGVATTVGELLKEFRSDFLEEFGLRFDNVEKIGETVQSIGTANRELLLERWTSIGGSASARLTTPAPRSTSTTSGRSGRPRWPGPSIRQFTEPFDS